MSKSSVYYYVGYDKSEGAGPRVESVSVETASRSLYFELSGTIILSRFIHDSSRTIFPKERATIIELKAPHFSTSEEDPAFIGAHFKDTDKLVWVRLSQVKKALSLKKRAGSEVHPEDMYVYPPDGSKPF